MKHDDHAAFVPVRFTDALRAGEIDGLQYALGAYLATACYEVRNTSAGVATVRLSALAELFDLHYETIRRKLHELEPKWIESDVRPGQRAWRIRLTGLASPAQAPLKLHRSSTPEALQSCSSTSTDEQPRNDANPHGESDSGPSEAPQGLPEPEDTRPDPTRDDQRALSEEGSSRSAVLGELREDDRLLAALEEVEQEPEASPAVAALERLRQVADERRRAREKRLAELRAIGGREPAGEGAILAEVEEMIAEGVLIERAEP